MVGIVIVSHSAKVAEGIYDLVMQMASENDHIIPAGGLEDGSIGTDAFKIQAAIEPLIQTRTSILIAHRLSTILAADEILVLRDGKIAEKGTHEELVGAGGVYTELYETQFKPKGLQEAAKPAEM